MQRTTIGACVDRARRLASALRDLGIEPGDPVATLMWNQPEHLEVYYAVPSMGAVLHTLNPRLHPDELSFIVNDAEDRAVIVDESLLEAFESFHGARDFELVIVVSRSGSVPDGYLDYESLIAGAEPMQWPRRRRAPGGGDVLHVGHDRAPERRGLLASRAGAALARRSTAGREVGQSARHRATGGADVPRQRVGSRVHGHPDRRRAWCFLAPSSTRSACSICSPMNASR